jgi:hypothetical protein
MMVQDAPKDWAQTQFGSCELGDVRRTKRLVKVGAAVAMRSDASLPKQMIEAAGTKAAYRLFANGDVTHSAVSCPHWEMTRERARAPGQGFVLFVQDQTELDFGRKPDAYELGFVGTTYARGIEVQTTMCVIPRIEGERPEVLGLALQTPWTRNHAPRAKTEPGHQRTKRRTEYDVWQESVDEIGPAPDEEAGTTWVSVGDRGSDVFTHLMATRRQGWKCLVRSKHDRKLADLSEEEKTLHARIRAIASQGSGSIFLRARPGQKARHANLNVSFTAVTLPATSRAKNAPSLEANCVRVWEEPRAGVAKAIEWILLTTLDVRSVQDALGIVELYRHRWLIEEYHKCLKTGCGIEHRHLNHRDKLLALLGVLSIVAVLLLQLKAPSPNFKPPDETIQLVKLITKAKEDLSEPAALLRRIAMFGGFLGRKGDGEPGWQTIWDGWMRIQDILWGIELASQMKCG